MATPWWRRNYLQIKMRTFIAVELPEEVKSKINKVIETLKPISSGVKWVEEKNLHITMKFLGEIKESEVERLIAIVEDNVKETSFFNAKYEGMGTFPTSTSPRVVWVGTRAGGEELKGIADSFESSLSKAGFRSEEREFTPHITIGRVKERKNMPELVKAIEKLKNEKFGEVIVDQISIMKSTLTPKGPIYEVVKKIKLT